MSWRTAVRGRQRQAAHCDTATALVRRARRGETCYDELHGIGFRAIQVHDRLRLITSSCPTSHSGQVARARCEVATVAVVSSFSAQSGVPARLPPGRRWAVAARGQQNGNRAVVNRLLAPQRRIATIWLGAILRKLFTAPPRKRLRWLAAASDRQLRVITR